MVQQTAMQALIAWGDEMLLKHPEKILSFAEVIDKAEELLQMEKEQMGYTKEDVLKAGEIGEINHYDYKHIVSLLDEAKAINRQNNQYESND
jgi:hypothetical protein